MRVVYGAAGDASADLPLNKHKLSSQKYPCSPRDLGFFAYVPSQ